MFFHLPRSTASSLFKLGCLTIFLHNLFPCPLWSTSWHGDLHLIFHTFPHPISDSFAAHAHTIATCFVVVSILYHLFLVFLSTPYLELLHIHLTILVSARWSATSLSFLTGQVSLPSQNKTVRNQQLTDEQLTASLWWDGLKLREVIEDPIVCIAVINAWSPLTVSWLRVPSSPPAYNTFLCRAMWENSPDDGVNSGLHISAQKYHKLVEYSTYYVWILHCMHWKD